MKQAQRAAQELSHAAHHRTNALKMKEIVTRMLTVRKVWYVELIIALLKVACNGMKPMTVARSLMQVFWCLRIPRVDVGIKCLYEKIFIFQMNIFELFNKGCNCGWADKPGNPCGSDDGSFCWGVCCGPSTIYFVFKYITEIAFDLFSSLGT